MDILFEVGRTPTPPKPPVAAPSDRAAAQREPSFRDRADDVFDNRKSAEDPRSRRQDERADEARREHKGVDDADRKRERKSVDDAGGKREAEEKPSQAADTDAGAEDAEQTQDSFSKHLAAKEAESKKPPAEETAGVVAIGASTAPPTPSKSDDAAIIDLADRVVRKATADKTPATQTAYQPAASVKAAFLATRVEAKQPVDAASPVTTNEPPKTAPVKPGSAIVTSAKAAATGVGGSKGAFTLPQELQGTALPEGEAAPDFSAKLEVKGEEGEPIRQLRGQSVKIPPTAFQRLAAAEFAPPVIPQTDAMIDTGASADASPDLAALKHIAASGTSQISAANAVSQSAAGAAPAASQIVAAVKAERVGNGNTIELRLDPPELGRVRIDMSLETADAVKAVLTAERSETLEHLRRNINDLMDQLKQAGFATVDLEFSNEGSAAFGDSEAAAFAELESDAPTQNSDVVYLSLRDDAQMDLLV